MGLLLAGIVLVMVAIVVIVLATVVGSSQSTGVARSLQLLNYQATKKEVGKNELGVQDRLLMPTLDRMRALAVRISPSGTGSRISRSLDRAGNPAAWSVERVMGAGHGPSVPDHLGRSANGSAGPRREAQPAAGAGRAATSGPAVAAAAWRAW